MQVVVDSLLTQYARHGSGKTVLILHGWGDSSKGMTALMNELAQTYDVIALDLPGFGGTQQPIGAWDLTNYAQFVQHFLQKIDQPAVYAVVGHSNGGGIAIRGLAHGLVQAKKLVLLGSAGIRGEYKGRNRALRMVAKTGKVLTAPLPKSVTSKLQRKVYKTIGSDMLVVESLQETFKKVVSDDVRADAQKITIPALIIYGQNDEQTPPRYGEIFKQAIAKSQLHVIPDAGHFVHLDQPQKTTALIKEFLA
ncbi:MAG TPA: alpha/beta hydrolase [Candidatus Saccharimonadales bacterium]|nr:alpha/beta hydrolase [Candidatus Saccharimonadales bacterium]